MKAVRSLLDINTKSTYVNPTEQVCESTKNIIQNFLNLPGVLGLGVVLLHEHYFYFKDETLDRPEQQAVTKRIVQNIVKTPKEFDFFDFPVLGYYAYIYKINPDVTLLVLTQLDLVAFKLLAAKQLKPVLQEDIEDTIAIFKLITKNFSENIADLTSVNTKVDILGDTYENALLERYFTIKDLLDALNHLSRFISKYLGVKITENYWQLTRPNFDWLENFKINCSAEIIFSGLDTEYVSAWQNEWLKDWTAAFIKQCSQIIRDLSDMIDEKCLNEQEKRLLLTTACWASPEYGRKLRVIIT